MDHADGLDLVAAILAQALLDAGGVDAVAPVARDELRLEAEFQREALPEEREVAALVHEDLVAGRHDVREGGFPCAGARGRVDDHRAFGLEDRLDAGENTLAELLERRSAVVDDGHRHRLEDAVGDRRRARDLEEMTPCDAGLIGRLR